MAIAPAFCEMRIIRANLKTFFRKKDSIRVNGIPSGEFISFMPKMLLHPPMFTSYMPKMNLHLPKFISFMPKMHLHPPMFTSYMPKMKPHPPKFISFMPKIKPHPPKFTSYMPKMNPHPPKFISFMPKMHLHPPMFTAHPHMLTPRGHKRNFHLHMLSAYKPVKSSSAPFLLVSAPNSAPALRKNVNPSATKTPGTSKVPGTCRLTTKSVFRLPMPGCRKCFG